MAYDETMGRALRGAAEGLTHSAMNVVLSSKRPRKSAPDAVES